MAPFPVQLYMFILPFDNMQTLKGKTQQMEAFYIVVNKVTKKFNSADSKGQ